MTVIHEAYSTGLMNILADVQDAAVAIGDRIEEAEGLWHEVDGTGENEADEKNEADVENENAKAQSDAGTAEKTENSRKMETAENIEMAENTEKTAPVREIILTLERFCEFLWRITQEQDTEERQSLAEEAWTLLGDVEQMLEQIPEQMAVVFMPYKASMWDCMESVWMAACEDPDCVPFVVPIPYFDLKDGQVAARHYEGDKFPDYVPVTDYSSFPLEEIHPGAIFIHNPFDDCNIVTTVLPEYYSSKLKNVTDRLVYIPYFVTGDGVYVTHRYLPAYENMDFIVTQCERTIDSFSAELPRNKFLPYGSPIADRILRLEKEKPPIPEEWKVQLKNGRDFGEDRVVMLNTSISMLMGQRERFLNKIEYLFRCAKGKKGIALVWRPHPLFYSTAQTMGEEYAARVTELEEEFLREKIGVLDKTPDVGIAVALCDAYLGEISSSVVNMFGIAGKPRFYINVQIPEKVQNTEDDDTNASCGEKEEDTEEIDENDDRFVSAWCSAENKEYYVLDKLGWIVEKDKETGRFTPLIHIPGRENAYGRAYRSMEMREGSLWLYPENTEGIFIYNVGNGSMRKIFGSEVSANEAVDLEDLEAPDFGEECMAIIKAERFKRGKLTREWREGNGVEDYFYFLQTASDDELTGQPGVYQAWIANLDGSCGRKVLQAVKESLSSSGRAEKKKQRD